jgi:hypothetical protein
MRIGRKIFVSAIVTLGAAGSILAGSAAVATTAQASTVTAAAAAHPAVYYHT